MLIFSSVMPQPRPVQPRSQTSGFQIRPTETGDVLRFTGVKRKVGNIHQTQLGKPFLNSVNQLLSAYAMTPPRAVLSQALTSASLMLEHYATEAETVASVLFTLRQHRPDQTDLSAIRKEYGDTITNAIEEAERFMGNPTPVTLSKTAAMLLASHHMAAIEHEPWQSETPLLSAAQHGEILAQLSPYLPSSYQKLITELKTIENQPVPYSKTGTTAVSDNITLTPAFVDGLKWASRLHRLQSRNATGTPYVSHLLDVASQIILHGGSENAVIGGLLHDAPEDQGGQAIFRRIRRKFAPEVAEIVKDLTQPEDIDDWYAEKMGYIGHIPRIKNPQSLIAMTSDKYHNLKSILHVFLLKGDAIWKSFHRGQNEQLWFYQKVLHAVQTRIPQHPIVASTQDMLQVLKATAFNREAKPFLADLLAKFPQYKALTTLTESLPTTAQSTRDANGKRVVTFIPGREGLHRQIIGKLYGEFKQQLAKLPPQQEKVAHIVTGMMGSGKTSMVVDRLPNKDAVFIVDSDRVKELVPEYNLPSDDPRLISIPGIDKIAIPGHNGLGATAIHLESSAITDYLLDAAIGNGDSFVISHTGRDMNYDIGFMKSLKAQGYKVFLHHIEIPPKVAIERSLGRFHTQGRFPPPDRVGSLGSLSTDNYIKLRELGLKEGFIDGCSWAYNGVPNGEKPIDIERVNC